MKKVKIMLLSLALFAVVGGALAFKAKLGTVPFCTAEAYWNETDGYYCSFGPTGQETIKTCADYLVNSTTAVSGPLKVCTTPTFEGIDTDAKCQTLQCTSQTTIRID